MSYKNKKMTDHPFNGVACNIQRNGDACCHALTIMFPCIMCLMIVGVGIILAGASKGA